MDEDLVGSRRKELFFYAPFNFDRKIPAEKQLELVAGELAACTQYAVVMEDREYLFYFKHLAWDSGFFESSTYKLYTALYPAGSFEALVSACRRFRAHLQEALQADYCFIEIPAEDILLVQALCLAGFKLSESRLTYFSDAIQSFCPKQRYGVRKATEADIPNLRAVASGMRNDFDRFHADPFIPVDKADAFLAKYVEEAVKGFSDIVLVPDEAGVPADSFLTANYLDKKWDPLGRKISKMVLSAVSSETNKGWYEKLISEMTVHLQEKGAEVAFMNTQPTNRAVFRVWEKLGYRLGSTTHVLTCCP